MPSKNSILRTPTKTIALYELQVKYLGTWHTVAKNKDEEYLKIVGERQYARFKKQRVLKIG